MCRMAEWDVCYPKCPEWLNGMCVYPKCPEWLNGMCVYPKCAEWLNGMCVILNVQNG